MTVILQKSPRDELGMAMKTCHHDTMAQARYASSTILQFWGDTARISEVTEKKQRAFAQWSCAKGHSMSYIARNLSVLSAALKLALGERAPKTWAWPATIADWLDLPEPEPRDWIPTDGLFGGFEPAS
jgi:hypothetical protein